MTDDMLNLMNERISKRTIPNEYYKLDYEIKNSCKLAKEQWFSGRCEEIEDLERKQQARLMHTEVKELTDRKHSTKSNMQSKNGIPLFEGEEIEKRWIEYISELYEDDTRGAAMTLTECEG